MECCCARKVQAVPQPVQSSPVRRGLPNASTASSASRNNLGGVGIVFATGADGTGLVVTSLAVDGPAHQSRQVAAEDILVSIDEVNVKGMLPDDLAQYILGPPGSKVKLGFIRKGMSGVRYVELARGWVMKRSTDSKWSNPLPPNHLLVPGVPQGT